MHLFSVGHSTRTFDELVALLRAHGVASVVDIRTVPKSRRHPHVAKESLEKTLPAAGLAYQHVRALGGLRKPRPDSGNAAWQNESFRGYADHMQSPEFAAGLAQLIAIAGAQPTAMMCAEAVPWRCHRQLVADALLAMGIEVLHIMSETKANLHKLTSFAQLDGTRVTYPALI